MPIQVHCTCGRKLAVREALAGKKIKCVYCGAAVEVPAEAAPVNPFPEKMKCPYCAGQIEPGLTICPFCNENLARHQGEAPAAPPAKPGGPAALRPRRPLARACPYCSADVTTEDKTCPQCAEPLEGVELKPRVRRRPRTYLAWEEEGRGVFARWWSTWSATQFSPNITFSHLPWTGGYGKPLNYVLFFAVQILMLACVCGGPLIAIMLGSSGGGMGASEGGVIVGVALVYVVALFIMQIVMSFVMAGIYHVCAMIVGGRADFETTYRAVCYSWGANVWSMIPYVGSPTALVFQVICLSYAFHYGHKLTMGRAVFAALLPMILCLAGVLIIVAAVIGSAGGPRF